jgi:Flp pilus assembly protein TadG
MDSFCKLIASVRNRKGQSIVEITLITPLLLVALYVPADFGIAYLVSNMMNVAARDGARIASTSAKSGGSATNLDFTSADAAVVRDKVVPEMPSYITARSVTVKFFEDTPANCLEFVEVTTSGSYSFFLYQLLRLFGATVNNPVTISRTAQMPYSNQPFGNSTKCTGTTVNQAYSNL